MKIIKYVDNDMKIVRRREDVYQRLMDIFKPSKACRLYNFYCAIQLNGEDVVKNTTPKDTFYRNTKELKFAKIDFSQSYRVEEEEIYYFNPFESKEVA